MELLYVSKKWHRYYYCCCRNSQAMYIVECPEFEYIKTYLIYDFSQPTMQFKCNYICDSHKLKIF